MSFPEGRAAEGKGIHGSAGFSAPPSRLGPLGMTLSDVMADPVPAIPTS
jgi:hypothetical protein